MPAPGSRVKTIGTGRAPSPLPMAPNQKFENNPMHSRNAKAARCCFAEIS